MKPPSKDDAEELKLELDIKRTNLQLVALFIAAASALFSALSAYNSWQQSVRSRNISLEVAAYSGKIAAMRDYATSYSNLNASLRATLFDLPWDVENDGAMAAMTTTQLKQNSVVARRAIDAYATYVTQTNAASPLWNSDIQREIVKAAASASQASECFMAIGSAKGDIADNRYWQDLKQRGEKPCLSENVRSSVQFYNDQSISVLRMMSAELSKQGSLSR